MYVVPNIMIMYALVFILKVMLWIVLFLYFVVRCNKQSIIGHSDIEKHGETLGQWHVQQTLYFHYDNTASEGSVSCKIKLFEQENIFIKSSLQIWFFNLISGLDHSKSISYGPCF